MQGAVLFLGSLPRALHRDNHALDNAAESRSEARTVSNSSANWRRVGGALSLFPDDPEQVRVEPIGTPVTLLSPPGRRTALAPAARRLWTHCTFSPSMDTRYRILPISRGSWERRPRRRLQPTLYSASSQSGWGIFHSTTTTFHSTTLE